MNNHFFIGIGGAGGNILREIRKLLFLRGDVNGRTPENTVNYEFLYVDSDARELQSDGWRILGNSVQLDEEQKLLILDGDLNQLMANIGQNPAITSWIGDRDEMIKLLGASAGRPGAQQRRRFGRFLFAVHAHTFVERVKRGFESIMASQQNVTHQCTFHLMGTLAGGTGSGGLLDAAMQIRATWGDAANFPIKLYCMITDSASRGADMGYFYPNQYAALKDINAVLSGRANFHNVLSPHGERMPTAGRHPIQVCYLTSNSNEAHVALDKSRQEKLIADWLVEVTNAEARNRLNADGLRTLTGEELLAAFPGEPLENVRRSYGFASLGIRRWASPQSLLRERLASSVAVALSDQLLFANWDNGYKHRARETNAANFLNQFPLTALGLERQQLANPEASNGREIEAAWAQWLARVRASTGHQADALEQLERRASEFYQRGYLERGVKSYFSGQRHEVAASVRLRVNKICGLLENALIANGTLGLEDVAECLNDYIKSLRSEISAVTTDLEAKKQSNIEAERKLTEIRERWGKVGTIADWLGARKRLLEEARMAIVTAGVARTWIEGFELARLTLQQLDASLQAVAANVGVFKTYLMRIREEFKDAHHTAIQQLEGTDTLIKAQWDREETDLLERFVLAHETRMRHAAIEVRKTLLNEVGLSTLATRSRDDLIRNCMAKAGDECVMRAHEEYADAGRRILNENIVSTLERTFRGNSAEIEREVTTFVQSAIPALRIQGSAVQPAATLGVAAPPMPKRTLTLLAPRVDKPGLAAFRDNLIALAQGSNGAAADFGIEESANASEITLVAENRWMAARFAEPVAGLKRKYEHALKTEQFKARYFCHLDDDSFEQDDLLPPGAESIRKEAAEPASLLTPTEGAPVTDEEIQRLPPHPATAGEPSNNNSDEDLQFTVFRPEEVQINSWRDLLAFAHLTSKRPDAPADEPEPLAEVERQARQFLGDDLEHYSKLSQDGTAAFPRNGEITFEPELERAEFNPARVTFRWIESVHREVFRFRVLGGEMGSYSRGRLNVFIGPFLAATVPLRIKIGGPTGDAVRKAAKRQTALAYRNIFVSYSHRDKTIVDICQHYAKAIGDRFLRDCIDLRTGEEWNPKLLSLIERADVFQLFWSSSASSSTYVRQEVAHALTLDRDGFIRPTYWQENWPPPWESNPDISNLHFERLPFGAEVDVLSREISSGEAVPDGEVVSQTPETKADSGLQKTAASQTTLHAQAQDSPKNQRLLSAALEQLGDAPMVRGQPGDAEGALKHFTRALEIGEPLLKANPDSAEAARDVSVSLERLGDLLAQRGLPSDTEQALMHYTRSLELREALLKANPASAQAARDVSVSLIKLGAFLARRRQPWDEEQASMHYARSLEIRETLLKANPDSAQATRDVWLSCFIIALLAEENGNAKRWYQRAYDLLAEMKAKGRLLQAGDEQYLEILREKLGK